MVASQGLEPQQAESESAVLPLHHEAVRMLFEMAGSTGLEPATPGSTVQCANQLRHNPVSRKRDILYHIYPIQCKWKFHLFALSWQICRGRGTFYHLLFHKSAALATARTNKKNETPLEYLRGKFISHQGEAKRGGLHFPSKLGRRNPSGRGAHRRPQFRSCGIGNPC
jgi:hypothetical protein